MAFNAISSKGWLLRAALGAGNYQPGPAIGAIIAEESGLPTGWAGDF